MVIHRYRQVTCHQGVNGKELDDDYCPEDTRPEELTNCSMDACPGWVTSNWSAVCTLHSTCYLTIIYVVFNSVSIITHIS